MSTKTNNPSKFWFIFHIIMSVVLFPYYPIGLFVWYMLYNKKK